MAPRCTCGQLSSYLETRIRIFADAIEAPGLSSHLLHSVAQGGTDLEKSGQNGSGVPGGASYTFRYPKWLFREQARSGKRTFSGSVRPRSPDKRGRLIPDPGHVWPEMSHPRPRSARGVTTVRAQFCVPACERVWWVINEKGFVSLRERNSEHGTSIVDRRCNCGHR